MVMEEGVSRLEGAYGQVDRRLSDLHQSVQSLREESRQSTESLRQEMVQNRVEINTRINLLFLVAGGIWATIVAGLIALFLKL